MPSRCSLLALAVLCLLPAAAAGKKAPRAGVLPPLHLEAGLWAQACGQAQARGGATAAVFPGSVECLELAVRLADVSGKHTVRFLYYDPAGNLYAATKADWTLEADPSTGYHRTATVRHRLPVAGEQASLLPGGWKVAVWLDGLTVSERLFELESRADPASAALVEARQMFLELRYEEALQRLEALGSSEPSSQALWWLAAAQSALGREADAQATLQRLLELEPAFVVDAAEVERAGAETLAASLEELRSHRLPQLYQRKIGPPEAELSAPEPPPRSRVRRWYQKWWVYAAAAAVAIPVTAVLAGGRKRTTLEVPDPPLIELRVSDAATRDPRTVGLCEGRIPLTLSIKGGQGPYTATFTVRATSARTELEIPGITDFLTSYDTVVLERQLDSEGAQNVYTPAVLVPFVIPELAGSLEFGVMVQDALTRQPRRFRLGERMDITTLEGIDRLAIALHPDRISGICEQPAQPTR